MVGVASTPTPPSELEDETEWPREGTAPNYYEVFREGSRKSTENEIEENLSNQ